MSQIVALLTILGVNALIFTICTIIAINLWIKRIGVFKNLYMRLLYQLRPEYWVLNCGLDAYLYLLFQRSILKLMLIFSLIAITIPLPVNLYTANSGWDWFEKIIFQNKDLAGLKSWIHVFIVILFTIVTLWTLYNLKMEAKKVFIKQQLEKTKRKNVEWLKLRTIHVRGLVPHDVRGNALKHHVAGEQLEVFLNGILEQGEVAGRVVDVSATPDFDRMFELENELQDLREAQTEMHWPWLK